MNSNFSISPEEALLLQLLKCSLFDMTVESIPSALTADINFSVLYEAAHTHSVIPLIYKPLCALVKQLKLNIDAIKRFRDFTIYSICRNDSLLAAQAQILEAFSDENIPHAILKGTSLSMLYPEPEMRVLGDIDILINRENMSAAIQIMLGFSYEAYGESGCHIRFKRDNIVAELHLCAACVPSSPACDALRSELSGALKNASSVHLGKYAFNTLSPCHQALSLLLHMEKHMSNGNISLRQICDWLIFVQKRTSNELWNSTIAPVAASCGLLHYAKAMTRMGMLYLSLPEEYCGWCVDASDTVCDALMINVLKNVDMQKSADSKNPEHALAPFAFFKRLGAKLFGRKNDVLDFSDVSDPSFKKALYEKLKLFEPENK